MPVSESAFRTSHTPAEAIKKPSVDLYHAQGINPAEQLHPSADHFVAQNYALKDLPPTTVHSFNRPESDHAEQNTYGQQHALYRSQHGTPSGMRSSTDEKGMSDRFSYNDPPKPGNGHQHGHVTDDTSGHSSRGVQGDSNPSHSSQHSHATYATSGHSGHSSTMVPSTHQMVATLEKGERALKERKSDANSACSDRLVDDLAQVVRDTLHFVHKKDLGDSARNIIQHSRSATEKAVLSSHNTQGIPKKGNVTRDVSDVVLQLRRFGQLMVTSSVFRNLLWDFCQLSRDSFGPQIDQVVEKKLAVQDNGNDAAPKYCQVHQSTQSIATLHLNHQEPSGTPFQPAQPLTARSSFAHSRSHDQSFSSDASCQDGNQNHDAPMPRASSGVSSNQSRFDGNGRQTPFDSLSFSSGTATTQSSGHGSGHMRHGIAKNNQKKEQLADRWRAMFDDIKQDSHIQEAVCDMKQTLLFLKGRHQPVVQKQKEKVKDAAIEEFERAEDLDVVLDELKGLLERFAGGKSLDPLNNVINEWYTTICKEEELSEWFRELYEYLDTTVCTTKLAALGHDIQSAKLDRFISCGQNIFQGRHSDLSRRFLDETHDFLYAFINDEATTRLRESVQNVIADLFIDAEGHFVVKPDVYAQLAKALMPILSEQLSKIQVCRVEEHNEEIEFTLTNIVLNANGLKPNQFEVKNITDVSVGMDAREGAEIHVEFRISVKGTTCSVQNANFYYKKHTFPKFKDSGVLDAALTGNGLSYDLDIAFFGDAARVKNVAHRDHHDHHHSIFKIKECHVEIDKLKMKFRNANHSIIYKLFKPIIVAKATKEVSHAIENHLRYFVKELDKAAVLVRDQALSTLDKTGARDRILRGTDPDELNVGHAASLHSLHSNRQTGQFDRLGSSDEIGFAKTTGGVTNY